MSALPTESKLKKQHFVAVLSTIAALLDGIALILKLDSVMVFTVIFLASVAVMQWSIYFISKSHVEINEEIKDQINKKMQHN